MTETLPQMAERHKQEKRQAVEAMNAACMTQTEAAKALGVSLTCLNNFVRRSGIVWRVIQQGKRA
jgi:DNA invertase Pin-like site-specific DNA recombinase